jgi:hypothetical protein
VVDLGIGQRRACGERVGQCGHGSLQLSIPPPVGQRQGSLARISEDTAKSAGLGLKSRT